MTVLGGLRICLALAATLAGAAAEKPAPPAPSVPPDRRELWVPANQLKDILAKYPNAVVLSREQYETLLRDAKLDRKKEPVAPRRAALTAAKYQARISGKVAQVTGMLTVNVLSDEWTQVALEFDGASLGVVRVDGEAAFAPGAARAAKDAAAILTVLLLRGRGERVVTVELTIPVSSEAGLNRLRCQLPRAAASSFTLDLPPEQRVESAGPIQVVRTPEKTSVQAGLPPANPVLELAWRHTGGAAALEPLVMANGIYTIDAEKLRAEYGFAIETQLGNLAAAYQIALPADAKVLEVTGDEIAKWDLAGGNLRITLQAGERSAAKFWIAFELPSLAGVASTTLALPVPRLDGLPRMQGVFSIVGDAGVTVKAVVTGAVAQPADRAVDPATHFVASYRFHAPPAPPRVTVEKVQPRFSADLDTRVEFRPAAIFIERTLTLHPEKGETFQAALTLPAGEEVLVVRKADDTEPDWRMEDGKLRLRWTERASAKTPLVFKIRTRSEPEKWTQLGADGLTFTLGDVKIDGAEKITGYIALQADDAFRLEAAPSETLERRDGRTTPVQGDYAWFRRQDFALSVKVTKRPVEVLATLTGYALPLEGLLDLHAQIDFQFLHSGARSVRVQVPEKLAQNFHFDGPQIAERNLAGDTWTIVFQKELTGSYALKVTAQVAVEKAGQPAAEAGVETRFQAAVPVIVPLDAVRTSGVWAIEANTETEITFEAKGMNELDSLLAPRLPEYQPRHRVIGVFAWLGKEYALSLSGVRHAPAAVLTSVVDLLTLDTVVSTSGTERSQATYQLRTAGAQYLEVQLPEKSRLLSLTVDDEVVKPVGDRPDRVRVQLPAKRDASRALTVSVLYDTPQGEWRRTGAYATRAPKLAREIPVLRSQWRLFVPEGFEYTGLESNLRVPEPESERPLVVAGPLALWDEYRVLGATAVLGGSGISDPRALDETLPSHVLAEARRRARLRVLTADPSGAVTTEAMSPPLSAPQAMTPPPAAPAEMPASTPEAVRKLFVEAQGFFDTGRFDLAKKRCDQIAKLDPHNIAARKLAEKIDRAISDHGVQALNKTRAKALKDVDLAWQRPIRRMGVGQEGAELGNRVQAVQRKLERIIIPKLEFREATIREAIDFLRKKSVELDTDSPAGERGVNIVLKVAEAPRADDARITVSLSNIPLVEALRYVTGLANLKFKVEPYTVTIVPMSEATDVLVTKEWKIAPGLIPGVAEGGQADREAAKNWLIANGLTFSGGATAIYIPRSSRLIVRNTQDQLDLIDTIVSIGGQATANWAFGLETGQRVSGLLPMKLELPKIGRVIELEGLAAAETVQFRYDDWWRRARRLWLWFVGGGLLALFFAGARPWWRTCWVVLVLTFFPYCVSLAAMPVCNALLAGWLFSVVLQRLAARFIFAPRRKEVLA